MNLRKVSTAATLVRTITADDVISFAKLSGDTNPVHFAVGSKALVHGAFLNSLVSALLGTQMPGPGAIVAEQTLRFPNKCFVGDTVTVYAELVQDRKIMKVLFSCVVKDAENKKEGKIVLEGDAKLIWNK